MKIKAKRSEDTLFESAALSPDPVIQRRAEQYVIDCLADSITDQDRLDAVLAAIPDPEQRFVVLDALKPLLNFKPKTYVEV